MRLSTSRTLRGLIIIVVQRPRPYQSTPAHAKCKVPSSNVIVHSHAEVLDIAAVRLSSKSRHPAGIRVLMSAVTDGSLGDEGLCRRLWSPLWTTIESMKKQM